MQAGAVPEMCVEGKPPSRIPWEPTIKYERSNWEMPLPIEILVFAYLLCGSLLLGGSFVAAWVGDRFGSWALGTGEVFLLMLQRFLPAVGDSPDIGHADGDFDLATELLCAHGLKAGDSQIWPLAGFDNLPGGARILPGGKPG
jgi:hypothetical protein